MARIKDESVEAVKAAANIVDLVEARTRLRKVGDATRGSARSTRRRRRRSPSRPTEALYHCFGAASAAAISFCPRDREPRLRRSDRVAGGPLSRSDRVRRVVAARRRAAPPPRAPARVARAGGVVLRARALGLGDRRRRARVPVSRGSSRRRRVASSGSASRRAARRLPARRATRASPRRSSRRPVSSPVAAPTTSSAG